ncbi:hypothetical protein [Dactylosporangium sp. CA-233914]|uniref:hypothetical protein n=1 Tax=Dactylosporangium sp. CA-233914 TaxID=3239934 RepID=UPI003D8FAE33
MTAGIQQLTPPTAADEGLFGTVMVAARLGRAEKIVGRLRERYEQEWDDPRAGFPYALALLALLQSGREDLRGQLSYTEIVETLSDLLYHEPGHWLGRYLRIHTRALLPADATEHRGYVIAERTRAAEDAAELVGRQDAVEWRPWFACTYLLAARLAWESGETGQLDRIPELIRSAAAKADAREVGFPSLGGLLCEGFVWYHSKPGLPERDTAAALMDTLFPAQPAVLRVKEFAREH